MPQFILKIDLGNDAMNTPEKRRQADRLLISALSGVLLDVKKIFDLFDKEGKPIPPNHYPVYDINGNVVGHYGVTE